MRDGRPEIKIIRDFWERNVHYLELKQTFLITYQALFNHFVAPTIILQVPYVHSKHILLSILQQPHLSTKWKAVFHVETLGNKVSTLSSPTWDVPFIESCQHPLSGFETNFYKMLLPFCRHCSQLTIYRPSRHTNHCYFRWLLLNLLLHNLQRTEKSEKPLQSTLCIFNAIPG